ncbi:MAG: tyrosine-type recombinase/integrase [Xanthobacteraceae bacterium]|nr:tyrosine-type recombinase/integrase [Xanthobacteraceae bacterium]
MSGKGIAQGKKAAIAPENIAAIRAYLETHGSARDRALFALGVDSMLRGCDLLRLRTKDVLASDGSVRETLSVVQSKISAGKACTVTCYLTPATRALVAAHVAGRDLDAPLFCGQGRSYALSKAQLRLLLKAWVAAVGLDPSAHSNHSLRRTKASALYKTTKDLELVRQALGHSHITSTQAYLGVGSDQVRSACLGLDL